MRDFSDTHFAAGVRAGLAGFSATLAMFIVVLAALFGALITDLRAQGAKAMSDAVADLTIGTRHEGGGPRALSSRLCIRYRASSWT